MQTRTMKGQSTLELCIMLAVVILALVGLQSYIKYAAAGRLKSSADSISQTLFNPHESTTKLDVYRKGSDITTTLASDHKGTGGAGKTDSVTSKTGCTALNSSGECDVSLRVDEFTK